MMDLTLCLHSEELKSRIVAAAVMMQANVRELDLDYLLKSRDLGSAQILIDYDVHQIRRLIMHLQTLGADPQRQIIRFIDKPWHAYVYHDIPIFASIVNPPDPIAAVEVIKKLQHAVPFAKLPGLSNDEPLYQSLDPLADCFTQSLAMKRAVEQLRKLAGLTVDTILMGETGVGKDTCAQWLHDESDVKGDFVHVNCAALPEQLFEAELFGVMAGAYTGAQKDRAGKLELAHQGTLYLDEIDSMSVACQAKLLNALQYRGATRLGASKPYTSDFRVIASSKVDFESLIRQGRFREDLYFRLNISKVYIPALRERLDDIGPLYQHFLRLAAQQFNLAHPQVLPQEWDALLSYPWRGNVRELKAHAQRRVIGLDLWGNQVAPSNTGLKDRLANFERTIIEQTLREFGGCTKKASEALKIPPHSLYYRLRRLGIPMDEKGEGLINQGESPYGGNSLVYFDTQGY